jgi:hypothetical protein
MTSERRSQSVLKAGMILAAVAMAFYVGSFVAIARASDVEWIRYDTYLRFANTVYRPLAWYSTSGLPGSAVFVDYLLGERTPPIP